MTSDGEERGKTFRIQGDDISDGYHTFDELYEHRCLLFIAWMVSDGCPGRAYWVRDHFEGWDLLVCEKDHYINKFNNPEQISYHVPSKHRRLYGSLEERAAKEHQWDGHTSQDVLERIANWIGD